MSTAQARRTLLALVAAGFAAGVAQVLLMRELLVLAYGNELSMGLLLACWLLAGAAGSLLARVAVGSAGRTAVVRAMAVLCALPAPLMMVSLAVVRLARPVMAEIAALCLRVPAAASVLGWLALRTGEMPGIGQIALLGALAALGPAALNGAQFALGCHLYARAREGAVGAGSAYAADAIGHLVGGVLLATVVVVLLDPFTICLAAGLANAAAALALLAMLPDARPRLGRLAAGGAIVLALLGVLAPRLHAWSLRWRWHNHQLLASVESIYGNLAVTRQEPDGIYLYQSGLYAGASPPLVGTIDELVHFTMLQRGRARHVLLVGGGITGGLREVLKHAPERVTYVELDRRLLDLAREWAAPEDIAALEDSRVNQVAADGRRFIGLAPEAAFDVIIIAAPDPATAQVNRLYTTGFYAQVARALTSDGVVGWEIPGSEGYFSPSLRRLHLCLLGSARTSFARIARMPGENTVCVAGPKPIDDPAVLQTLLLQRGVQAPYFEAIVPDRLSPATLQTVNSALRGGDRVPLNTDLRPIGYYLDQAWWLTQFHPRAGALLERLSRLRLLDILPVLAGLCTFLVLLTWLRPVRAAFVPLAVAGGGFASMSLEMALLFAFQAFYGYVYQMVGVIIGAFMVGVALGAILAERWLRSRAIAAASHALPVGLGALALVSVALGVSLPFVSTANLAGSLVALFPAITALVGLAVGAIFPLASHAAAGHESSRAAAGLYAADLAGAALGAVFAGAFMAPVLGLPGTCWAAALVAGVALLLTAVRAPFAR